jgi:rod shape determining protein RodA
MRTRGPDWIALFLWLCLVGIGLAAIYSTTHGPAAEFLLDEVKQNFPKQLMWLGICIVGTAIALLLPVSFFRKGAYWIYAFTLALCVLALAIGKEINGATSWIRIGPLSLQVSELAKVGAVLAAAQFFSTRKSRGVTLKHAVIGIVIIMVPTVLTLMQNDTGTALVFMALIPVMLFWSGLPLPVMSLMMAPAVVAYVAILYWPAALAIAAAITLAMWWTTRSKQMTVLAGVFTIGMVAAVTLALTSVLQPHQVARIQSFTNPEAEEFRLGVGFHLVQSKAAIGSGGLTGKGFMEGTQTQGAYVPEQSTDFVFSVIGEEFGFVGTITVLVLFSLFLMRLTYLGLQIKHPFGWLVATGAVGIYLTHVFINVGMTTGLLPVIGIPLPFISYGGSALLANTALLAIVLSMHMRRDDFSIYGY